MSSRRRTVTALLAAAAIGLAGAACSDPQGTELVELQQQVDRLHERIDFLEEQMDIAEAEVDGDAGGDAGEPEETTTTEGS